MSSRYKVAVVTICLNPQYWPYLGRMIESAKKFFLKGHEIDYFTWSDMPVDKAPCKVFPTEPFTWPLPTLKRYHLFLQQEELLSTYDYILYVDADMEFVAKVGDEVLGQSLTMAEHPMYCLAPKFIPPYEPNPESTAFIPRLGKIIEVDGKKRLKTLYAAGGFQGGTSESFIQAMKVMKANEDKDYMENRIGIWNDESHWNAYLFRLTPTGLLPDSVIALSPEYVYPDSLNRAYYQRIWGRNFVPRLITLTKPFSMTKQAGQELNQILK